MSNLWKYKGVSVGEAGFGSMHKSDRRVRRKFHICANYKKLSDDHLHIVCSRCGKKIK